MVRGARGDLLSWGRGNNGGGGPPEVQNLAVVLSVSQSDRPGNLRYTVMEGEVIGGGALLPLWHEQTCHLTLVTSPHGKKRMNDAQ
jgi:hypothetical protein